MRKLLILDVIIFTKLKLMLLDGQETPEIICREG